MWMEGDLCGKNTDIFYCLFKQYFLLSAHDSVYTGINSFVGTILIFLAEEKLGIIETDDRYNDHEGWMRKDVLRKRKLSAASSSREFPQWRKFILI